MKVLDMDIRGQICPSSLLLALREINLHHQELVAGQLSIVVLTDNRDATGTIPEAVHNMGIDAVVEKMDGYYRITTQQQSN
ncbi:MAG: sulfurtransferase TusA family protein [Desulfuromonadales bacterium]|nr:sulfurtransferase TusA family protein [Desulfuromonadales bacterium]